MRSNVIALSFLFSISIIFASLQKASAKYFVDTSIRQIAESAGSALSIAKEIRDEKKASDEIYYFTNYVPKELKKNRKEVLKQQDPTAKKSMQEAFNKNADGYASEIKLQYDKQAKLADDPAASKKERKKAKKNMSKLKEALEDISYEKQLVEKDKKNFARSEQMAAVLKAKKEAAAILVVQPAAAAINNTATDASSVAGSADQGSSSSVSSGSK